MLSIFEDVHVPDVVVVVVVVVVVGGVVAVCCLLLAVHADYELVYDDCAHASLQKGLRLRISPTCTLSQNGYGDIAMAD